MCCNWNAPGSISSSSVPVVQLATHWKDSRASGNHHGPVLLCNNGNQLVQLG